MQPNPIQNGPAFGGGYVPYFYESGKYLFSNIPAGITPAQTTTDSYSRYDFSSDTHPWLPAKGPQTVEQIISSGYFAVPVGEPETAIISDKNHTSRLVARTADSARPQATRGP